jgi:rhamnosyltransferase
MATYNGEKYLSEQIDSIIAQSNKDWTLYIQDDGSKDHTLEIIQKYADGERIVWIDRGLTRQGCTENFMTMLNMVESKYYMFCDQDDVWLPQKVEVSVNKVMELEKMHPDLPILVHTDKMRVDENLNVILDSELNRKHEPLEKLKKLMKERNSLDYLRLTTFIAGCVMCFNHKAKEVAIPYNNSRYQDSIVAMAVAGHNGIIETIFEPTMLYRLHHTNTCGVSETSIPSKIRNLQKTWQGQLRMFYLYKIYGGGGLLKFLKLRIRHFQIRGL